MSVVSTRVSKKKNIYYHMFFKKIAVCRISISSYLIFEIRRIRIACKKVKFV